MTDVKREVTMPVASVELQEGLFAATLCATAQPNEPGGKVDCGALEIEIRKAFRYQRFAVMNWLLMNGVSIPASLLTDQAHPHVGAQYPDTMRKR